LGISTEALIATPNRFALFKVIIVVVVVAVIALDTKLITASNPYSEDKAKAVAKNLELPEYLPERADPAAVNDIEAKTPFVSSKSKTIIDMHAWGPANRKFNVISDGALLAIRTFYFPGWKAWVDGAEVPIGVQDKTGAILIDVPAGKHSVELKFTDTWPRKAGWIISIATLVLLVFPYGRLRTLRGRAV